MAASSAVLFFCANLCALRFLPLALSLKPQRHKDFLRRREGRTTHYGLRKILRCTATKATLIALYFAYVGSRTHCLAAAGYSLDIFDEEGETYEFVSGLR